MLTLGAKLSLFLLGKDLLHGKEHYCFHQSTRCSRSQQVHPVAKEGNQGSDLGLPDNGGR
jgi:hypothetical protein